MPSESSQSIILPAAGIVSARRSAIAAFIAKVRVSPASSVKRRMIPSFMPCTARPVVSVALAISSLSAAPGVVCESALSHLRNCETVKFPGIGSLLSGGLRPAEHVVAILARVRSAMLCAEAIVAQTIPSVPR